MENTVAHADGVAIPRSVIAIKIYNGWKEKIIMKVLVEEFHYSLSYKEDWSWSQKCADFGFKISESCYDYINIKSVEHICNIPEGVDES